MAARTPIARGPRVSVCVAQDQYDWLNMIARQRSVSASAIVRWAVAEYINRRVGQAPSPESERVAV